MCVVLCCICVLLYCLLVCCNRNPEISDAVLKSSGYKLDHPESPVEIGDVETLPVKKKPTTVGASTSSMRGIRKRNRPDHYSPAHPPGRKEKAAAPAAQRRRLEIDGEVRGVVDEADEDKSPSAGGKNVKGGRGGRGGKRKPPAKVTPAGKDPIAGAMDELMGALHTITDRLEALEQRGPQLSPPMLSGANSRQYASEQLGKGVASPLPAFANNSMGKLSMNLFFDYLLFYSVSYILYNINVCVYTISSSPLSIFYALCY